MVTFVFRFCEKQGRKVRAPKGNVAANGRRQSESRGRIRATETRLPKGRVKRRNLYVEQGRIGNNGTARSVISFG